MTPPGSTWLRGPVAPDGLAYHRIQEAGRPGVWRPLVGILVMFLGFVLFGALIATIVFQAVYLVTGRGTVDVARLADLAKPTPAGLAFLNVALATFIPLAMLTTRFVHGIAPRWLASVRPRIRWRYLFACLGEQGQYLVGSPGQLLTIVRLGHTAPEQEAALHERLGELVALFPG